MARPGLVKHPKFLRLCHMLDMPAPHVLGHLECLWSTCYETGRARIGDAIDVELAAGWVGEMGKLTAALIACGGKGRPGFINTCEDDPDSYQVHDLYDHAPDYVVKRHEREMARQAKGKSISELRAAAGKKGAETRWQNEPADATTDEASVERDANCSTQADDSRPEEEGKESTADAEWITRIDWDEAIEWCRRKIRPDRNPVIPRNVDLSREQTETLLKLAAAVLCGVLPEACVDAGLEAVRHRREPDRIKDYAAFVFEVVRDQARKRGIRLANLMRQMRVPEPKPPRADDKINGTPCGSSA